MKGFSDIVIVLVFAWAAFSVLSRKEALGKKKQDRYTKESREKYAKAIGYIYIFITVFSAFYALCNHGVIGLAFDKWVFMGSVLVVGIIGIAVLERIMLVKVEGASSGKSEKKDNSEDEDF